MVLLPTLNWGDPVDTDADFLLPTGTVTLLLADVEASTRLWEDDGEAMASAIADLGEVVADLIGRHDGVRPLEQGEGDSFVAAFARASDAVACALAIQQKLTGGSIRLRMGIHSAEAQRGSDKTYVGPSMNRTARLRDAGHGGQVLLSGATAVLVTDHLPDGAGLLDLGSHRLRDLSRPEHIHQLTHPDLQADFPPLRTLATYRHNLPEQRSRFIGRAVETAEVVDLIGAHRLVTLHGGGGSGKTRLALHVAAALLDEFPAGVNFADLSSVTEPEAINRTILAAMNLGGEVDTALDSVVANGRRLLVLDNCEHLIDACAATVERLLQHGPELRILTTSREPLAVDGEVTYRVPSLSVPPEELAAGIEGLAPYAAAELFIDRASKVRPELVASDADVAAIADICRRLDGVPLAIELAAARVRSMTPAEIAAGLDERFRLLTGGRRTALPRQQTLRASVDWSHDLLTEAERVVFRRLSVFVGGFTLADAKAVTSGNGVETHQVVDLIGLLVDKSLLLADRDGDGSRYRMLETIRAYAKTMLEASGELLDVQLRHRDHFVSIDEIDILPPHLDLENLVAAYKLSLARDELDAAAAAATRLIWRAFGARTVGTDEVVERAADLTPASRTRLFIARCVSGGTPPLALLAFAAEDLSWCEAHGLAGEAAVLRASMVPAPSLEALQQIADLHDAAMAAGDRAAAVAISLRMTNMAEWSVPGVDATPYWERTLNGFRSIGGNLHLPCVTNRAQDLAYKGWVHESLELSGPIVDDPALTGTWRAMTLTDRATCLLTLTRLDEAEQLLHEALALYRQIGDHPSSGIALHRLGMIHLARGRPDDALDLYRQGVEQIEPNLSAFHRPTLMRIWSDIAEVHAGVHGDLAAADDALAAAEALAASPWHRALVDRGASAVARVRGELDEALDRMHESLAAAAAIRLIRGVTVGLEMIAGLRARDDRTTDAARIFGAADAIRTESGDLLRVPPFDQWYIDDLALVRASLDGDGLGSAWAEGAAMTWREAVAYVQRGRGERKRPTSGWGSLTPTETRVADLVAEGLSNQEIADRMFISVRTVGSHLTHIYTKLNVSKRTELVAELHRRH